MISPVIKLSVSEFVLLILQNDALEFGFVKSSGEANINGFLNILIPNLVFYRQFRRRKIHDILENQFLRTDAEKMYECVNTVIDQVYFSDAELNRLEETIWLRPSQGKAAIFDEIESSETVITGQCISAYIRGLLNEYCRLPQYKRESISFDDELRDFADACATGKIFHAAVDGRSIRMFAFHYVYEYTFHQGNYLIGYNLTDHCIEAIPLHKMRNTYVVERKFKPGAPLISALQTYFENGQYDASVKWEEKSC